MAETTFKSCVRTQDFIWSLLKNEIFVVCTPLSEKAVLENEDVYYNFYTFSYDFICRFCTCGCVLLNPIVYLIFAVTC